MKFLLIKAENNYADEFDLEGFIVVKGEEAERALKLINVFDKVPDQEINFGTNESVYLHHTSWEIKELSEIEYIIIISALGEQYGLLNVDYLLDAIEEGSLFLEERDILVGFLTGMKNKLAQQGKNYWEFLSAVRVLDKIVAGDVVFTKYETWDSETTFEVTKLIDGEEYNFMLDASKLISY